MFDRPRNVLLAWIAAALATANSASAERPHVLLITVDTLRADRLSGYGYERRTSPHLDRLMNDGVRFSQARTVIPLTCPALSSMLTSLQPHEHGSTRNGLPIRKRLPSLPKMLQRAGYETAAFVSNSVLRGKLCGLDEHFDIWEEVLTRRRMLSGWREAHAGDVTERGLEFISDHLKESKDPFFVWLHYVEPHFPYNLQEDYLEQIGVSRAKSTFSPRNRYDSEIARVDDSIGDLLERIEKEIDPAELLVLFTSDHGESLGHHGYWGHGKHVYDAGLHIPLSITWRTRVEPRLIEAPAINVDIPATLLSLLSLPLPDFFQGFNFAPAMRGTAPAPLERDTYFQSHKSSVLSSKRQPATEIRPEGLNEVGVVRDGRKEILQVRKQSRRVFDLRADPGEKANLVVASSQPSEDLQAWLFDVQAGLEEISGLAIPQLDDETVGELKALGYVE